MVEHQYTSKLYVLLYTRAGPKHCLFEFVGKTAIQHGCHVELKFELILNIYIQKTHTNRNVYSLSALSGQLDCTHFLFFYFSTSLSLGGNLGHLTLVRHSCRKSSATHSYQCVVFSCVQIMAWLPVFGIFNVHTDVDACNCTRGLYRHRESALEVDWQKNPLPQQVLEPASVLCLAFKSDTLPTELYLPPHFMNIKLTSVKYFVPLKGKRGGGGVPQTNNKNNYAYRRVAV